jgi:hypothetical protein
VLTKRARRMSEWFEWLRGPSEDTFTMQQRGIASAPNTAHALLDAAYEYLGKARKPKLDLAWRLLEHDPWPLPNVHLGVSVENQGAADERIPELLRTPAAVRFLSCEPLLGPVTLDGGAVTARGESEDWLRCVNVPRVNWVIAGCESGPFARPCDVTWLRSLRDQCAASGVPYFLKQGCCGCKPCDQFCPIQPGPGSKRKAGGVIELPYLDGVQHANFPAVRQ